jgi:hypothetical protein
VKPLSGDALAAGRKLRAADAPGDVRRGLDIPFPADTDPAKDSPDGERISRGR